MDDQTVVIVALVVIFGIVIIAIVSWFIQQQKNEEREQEFAKLAAGHGLQFVTEDDSYSKRYDDGEKPFRAFGGGKVRNILQGSYRGRPVCVFEYRYTTTSSNGQTTSSTTHHFPVWVVGLPHPAPLFTVGAEGIFGGKVASAMGFSRLDIGDKVFDDTFKIKCDDEQFGRRVLHPAVIELLRRTGPWDWRFSGPNMISYEQGVFEPAQALPRLDMMCDLLDRIPDDAWVHTGG